MKTIELSDEAHGFLVKLAREMKSQDNRSTASPYFYVVECKREIAAPEGTTSETRYFDPEDCESYTEEQYRKRYVEWFDGSEPTEEFEEFAERRSHKYDIDYVYEHENVFLTKKGYDEHIQLNGHNYRHFKEHYSYVCHAGRNPEMASLCEAILEFDEK